MNVDPWGCNIVGDAGNEPSIAVSLTDPRKMVIGWRQFDSVLSDFRQPGWAYSHDGGHTWVFRGSLDPGVFGSDPVLAAGPAGELYYFSINFEESRLFRSLDGGMTWPQRTQASPGLRDKPWMAVDGTHGIGRGNIYIASQNAVTRSADRGYSFTRWVEVRGPDADCAGTREYPTLSVAPDGALYFAAIPGGVANSEDAQCPNEIPTFECLAYLPGYTSFFVYDYGVPNPSGLHGQLWIATDHSEGTARGNVYLLGLRLQLPYPLDLAFSRSSDGGTTWSDPIRVNDDPEDNGAWQWFAMMSVAPNGRIDAVWNDTRNSGQANLSELFYSYSTDAGETWSKNIPVSPMFDSWVGWPQQPKLGDYYHMVSDNLGVNVAYAATFNGEQDIYFLRIGPWDCNGNQIDDALDISEGRSRDCNSNGVPDECEYRCDLDGDGLTGLSDFASFQRALTGPAKTALEPCGALLDIDHDSDIDLLDFAGLQRVFTTPKRSSGP